MNQTKRQTGRSTRMLQSAVELSEKGKAVYVIAASTLQREYMKRLLREMVGDKPTGIKVETAHDLDGRMNWHTMRLIGSHPNCEVLVDHHAIEVEFCSVIEMYERFDLNQSPPPTSIHDEP